MPLLESPSPEPRPWWRNGAAAALVGLLHALLIGFIAISLPTAPALLPSQHEVFLFFHPAQKPAKPQSRMIPAPQARSISPSLFRYSPPPPSTALSPPMVTGLGQSLFGCAPENLANLAPDQRARCAGNLGEASFAAAFPGAPHQIAIDAGRWRQAMRERNLPTRVPCTYTEQVIVNGITGETKPAAMLDPLCALRHLAGETQ